MTDAAQLRIEDLFEAQARVRAAYREGQIDRAIAEYAPVRQALGAVDPRVSSLARRLAYSLIEMVDADLK
jgi:hypothetical protein